MLVGMIFYDCVKTKLVIRQYLVESNYDKLLRYPISRELQGLKNSVMVGSAAQRFRPTTLEDVYKPNFDYLK